MTNDNGYISFLKKLDDAETRAAVVFHMVGSSPADVSLAEYRLGEKTWKVWDAPSWKIVGNSDGDYNYFYSKADGFTVRFGRTPDEDPSWCPLGPEILDLEVITNHCIPIGGHTCRFCYKGNNSGPGKCMTAATFRDIVSRFPKNLSQIAFGITSLHGNKDFPEIVKACREEFGITPNVTTSGADLDDEMCDLITSYMGACAVSCYEADPSLCYRSIKKIYDYAMEKKNRKMHVNMHLLFSTQNFDFVMKTLEDIKNGKVPGLKSVVLLRMKNVGNAKNLDPSISDDLYRRVISYCLDNDISFGFDSCGAKTVSRILSELGRPELCRCCEPCESSSFSSYVNVDGMYTSCSFVESRPDVIKPLNVLDYTSFTDLWLHPSVEYVRNTTHDCKASCPWYNLDA